LKLCACVKHHGTYTPLWGVKIAGWFLLKSENYTSFTFGEQQKTIPDHTPDSAAGRRPSSDLADSRKPGNSHFSSSKETISS